MKQSTGADLLGANDPRSTDIGLIYVSPTDDRQSVLSAILTQENFARKQIVIVLPERNNALNRSVDFDGLKEMRRELQAELVIVASPGSGPAEFARQRRFTVYPSLDAFTQTLRDIEPEPEPTPAPDTLSKKRASRRKASGDAPVAPVPLPSAPAPSSQEEVSPAPSQPQSAQAMPALAPEDDATMEFPLASPAVNEALPSPPRSAEPEPQAGPATSAPSGGTTGGESAEEEQIILIPPPSRVNPPAAYPLPAGPMTPVSSSRSPGSSSLAPSVYMTPTSARRPSRRWWLIAIPLLLLILLLAFFAFEPLRDLVFVPKATVTITPISKDLKRTYTLTAVPGVPNPGQQQVQARLLYAVSPSGQKTVNASGLAHVPAVQATGILTFYNSLTTPQVVPAGTVFTGKSGIAIVNDIAVTIPAASPPGEGSAAIPAHAIAGGANGNIPAFDLSNVPCCGGQVFVQNESAFNGGADAQSYTYVEQSDIDSASSALAATLTPGAQAQWMKQVRKNEQAVSPPQCAPSFNSDRAPGEQAPTVTVDATVICTGEVYDRQDVSTQAANLLTTDPSLNPGPSFLPVGNIVTTVERATSGPKNTLTLTVTAEGIWVYQFSDAQRQSLLRLITGKSQDDARTLLMKQQGVDKTSIQLYGGNGTSLPSDMDQITLAILGVPGLRRP